MSEYILRFVCSAHFLVTSSTKSNLTDPIKVFKSSLRTLRDRSFHLSAVRRAVYNINMSVRCLWAVVALRWRLSTGRDLPGLSSLRRRLLETRPLLHCKYLIILLCKYLVNNFLTIACEYLALRKMFLDELEFQVG